jgi:Ca-activated chloride channel family protein
MAKQYLLLLYLFAIPFSTGRDGAAAQSGASTQSSTSAQNDSSRLHVNVVLVQLNVAVTDRKGNYVSGIRPEDFEIVEDKIPEKLSTFEEGNEPTRRVRVVDGVASLNPMNQDPAKATDPDAAGDESKIPLSRYAGANVFILFDTSNYMYKEFVFAQDAIGDFVRSLEGVGKVALYSYSRNLSRITALTSDRSLILRGVRNTVAGDDEALYNSLLLTVKDAAHLTGRKAIVVFSNGPDNASLVPPEDVAELAQSTGTIIYMISTQEAQKEPVSSAVFERVSKATGGKAYFSKNWRDQKQAFESIRDDLAHLYTLSYYPQPNPNRGWRSITVKLVGKNQQKYHIRTRVGYRLLNQTQASTGSFASSGAESASN